MKEKEQGKERYLEKGGGRREGETLKVVTKRRMHKGRRAEKAKQERNVHVFIELVCRIICVLCNVSRDKRRGGVELGLI